MSLLVFDQVTKSRPGQERYPVLERVSFTVEKGDFVGIQGERRSGKSTLLRLAAGWEPPDDGTVVFDGHDLARISESKRAQLRRTRGIALVSGVWRPSCNKSTVSHVGEVLLCARMSLREAQVPAHRALERVGLSECAYTPSNQLSPAELVRLSLARGLVHEPRLLLVDEPAVLLRPGEATQFYELLRSLGHDPGLTLVIASENLAPIDMARRRLSLDDGRLRSVDREGMLISFPEQRRLAK